jgi:hypothetical protein
MNRRKFVGKAALTTAGLYVGLFTNGLGIGQVIKGWIDKGKTDPKVAEKLRLAAEDLFYLNKGQISLAPASNNPNVRSRLLALSENPTIHSYRDLFNYFSNATIEASNAFRPFLFPTEGKDAYEHLVSYDKVKKIVATDTNHTIIALGTPTSNHIIRDMMFYSEMTNPDDGHVRHPQDMIDMPIKFELSAAQIRKHPKHTEYRSRGPKGEISKKIPNWGIINPHGHLLLPATDDGFLLEDFLVISVIPNFKHPDNIERDVPVVCMGGTHAAGTLAIKELLISENCLTSLQEQLKEIGNPLFWQAVFRIKLKSPYGTFQSISLEKEMVKEVIVDRTELLKYSEMKA